MKLIRLTLLCTAFAALFGQSAVFPQGDAGEYLCELGIHYYRWGKHEDALAEFKKALLIDPDNQTAKDYINKIASKQKAIVEEMAMEEKVASRLFERERTIEEALQRVAEAERLISKEEIKVPVESEELLLGEKKKEIPLNITGEAQVRLGLTSEEVVWKRANFDLNEKNWRMLSDAAFNQRENTYDPRIYDRLRINLDTDREEGFNFHANITVDPWSFTGKSDKVTIISSWGVPAEIELKYWSNTGHTIDEIGRTFQTGDSFAIPEIKVISGKTQPTTVSSNWSGAFTIPELKIHREFQPVRELWLDYQQGGARFRFFPFAYENQAFTFDDPLGLSNNRTWWEESPWIRRWKPGIYNSGPGDFTKGYWDNSIAFSARDSEGSRLTSLRGFSFEFEPSAETSIQTALATPKDIWQEYSDVDNIILATRLKHKILDDLSIGATYTSRIGFNLNEGSETDARNNVVGLDLGYEIAEGIKSFLEIAYSHSDYDLTSSQYKTESRGNAYYFSVISRYPRKSIMDLEYGYDGIEPENDENFFAKARLFVAHMDEGFDPSLSSYRETRDDEFWSRHIHFRRPFKYYYIGFYQESLTWDGIKPYRIGDGIDVGRDVLGFRLEASWRERADNLFDLRNVHNVNGKYIETVARNETTWKINHKLTAKALGIYQDLPKTKAGVDPFIFDPQSGRYFENSQIEDGKDPSIKTGSLGLKYELFDWLAVNGIWERTNDYSLGYDNFPRSMLNSGSPSYIYWEGGEAYRDDRNWVYSQQFFPRPPYPYYDIFKAGLMIKPLNDLEVYLDYTRNEYESAGQIDDNINHFGMEVRYLPTPKLGFYLRYVYSRWQDLERLTQGITEPAGHHNFFAEVVYRKTEDEDFVLQYGEADRTPIMGEILTIGWDPYGGSLRTIDTQHIIRLYYSRRF